MEDDVAGGVDDGGDGRRGGVATPLDVEDARRVERLQRRVVGRRVQPQTTQSVQNETR